MNEWQPIETAPKDGTYVLTVVAGYVPCVYRWHEYNGVAKFGPDAEDFAEEDHFIKMWDEVLYSPTHWMPLPEAPK
jgi:hypothetical protein